ncbi:TPA: hypothetical protein QH137_000368 [Klebsiella aerogenes]|uniref:hypothetical protein n=1 Tax=Klebsiella aerogenes TaxID=548 RepID=UPI0013A66324|nr:hypothetical protein [Klebsiella aerogenes]MBQ0676242.1 hypothetical protein [Klebsiella aerogenes]MCU6320015.1 hypothetical protein [Klebsiella aerogenes]HCB3100730.1 hypothetical protein [Klebsiella aerogenes]HCH0562422.1 hypothetical protein [Klebsiella aerogenes]HCH0651026.1 hypothetical protein [Klebsiella aerogenes]
MTTAKKAQFRRCRPDKALPPSGVKAGALADEYDPELAQAPRPGYPAGSSRCRPGKA